MASVATWRRRYVLHGLDGIRRQAPRIPDVNDRARAVATRILRATYDVAPPDGHRWTTRTLGEFLGVSHMQVYRVWKLHGIRIDHAPWVPPLAPPAPWVDVVGLFRMESIRAIIFGMEISPEPSLRRSPYPSGSGPPQPDPPALIYVPAPGAPELDWSLEELRELIPGRAVTAPTAHDLAIFLHFLESRSPSALAFRMIVECPDARARQRLHSWVQGHPRFEIESAEGPVAWREAIDRFVHGWDRRRLSGSSFRGVGLLAEALARFAGRVSSGPTAFTWSLFHDPPRFASGPTVSSATPGPTPPRGTSAPPALMPVGRLSIPVRKLPAVTPVGTLTRRAASPLAPIVAAPSSAPPRSFRSATSAATPTPTTSSQVSAMLAARVATLRRKVELAAKLRTATRAPSRTELLARKERSPD